MNLVYSESESRVLGIRVARAALDVLDADALREEIASGRFDLCKLKLPLNDPDLQIKLDRLGFPYVITDHIHVFKVDLRNRSTKQQLRHPDLTFELYDGSQIKVLTEIITEVFKETPGSFYRNPIVSRIIPQSRLNQALAEWVSGFHSDGPSIGKKAWLVKIKDSYAGVYVCEFHEGVVETLFAGVLPKYRLKGVYEDMNRFARNNLLPEHIQFGSSPVQIHNIPVYRSWIREGIDIRHAYVSIQLNTFLSYGIPNRPRSEWTFPPATLSELDHKLNSIFDSRYTPKRVHFVAINGSNLAAVQKVRASVVYDTGSEALVVAVGEGANDELLHIRYLEAGCGNIGDCSDGVRTPGGLELDSL